MCQEILDEHDDQKRKIHSGPRHNDSDVGCRICVVTVWKRPQSP